MKPKITYQQLREELEKRGWIAELIETESLMRQTKTEDQREATEVLQTLAGIKAAK